MPTYSAQFRTDADFAERTFEADTPEQSLTLAQVFYDEHSEDLMFESYDSGMPVNEIEIADDEGTRLAVWQDENMRLRLAARDLLTALEIALERLEISNCTGEEDEYIAQAKAAITKAKPAG
jgi:hypothetical protein